ncbi:hypothetical protein MBAV_001712 [Candidatus Magnetobacterium bavaricum]|uniref:Uncharacterized protein n=1 Tax=Candidatus Magnetobacterium bavaricum TaxID=29290 RepID=A0A0F3GVT9_9BACT|nr:hypothetical protein MBAV_001712 [Candidatus Magnetobacterium bavaricum]
MVMQPPPSLVYVLAISFMVPVETCDSNRSLPLATTGVNTSHKILISYGLLNLRVVQSNAFILDVSHCKQ